MVCTRIAALTLGLAATTGMAITATAFASDSPTRQVQSAPGAAQHAHGGREGRPGAGGPALFSPGERAQFEQKMRSAKTPEERDALRREMRAAFEERARERGIAPGQRADRPQLGRADHERFQERWQNARTPEERDALRREMLATVDQRTEHRNAGRAADGGPDARRPQGPRAGPMSGPMAKLVTPQEREQFRDKMKNAKDREERHKIMQEMHATVEARAREKGIKLPEHRRPMRGPRSEGREHASPQG